MKVQFHWDRKGKKDENSSCWVRVSQTWAGKNWGWMRIPRIGQEVIVDFLEGDPDQPIITGRVYNAEQMPPYDLPGNQTQTGIKTRSSKGGGTENFNEIRFEDKKGSEMFTVHAEKDMDTTVENDDTPEGAEQPDHQRGRNPYRDDRREHRDRDHARESVHDAEAGQPDHTLDMGNQSTKLKMGNQTTKVDLGKIETEAMQSIELKVGQSSIKIDQMGVTIKGMMIKIDGQVMTQVEGKAMLICKGGITMIN